MSYEYSENFARFYDVIYHHMRDGVDHAFFLNEISQIKGKVLEIGVGTGRFAHPFGIKDGVEPSSEMRRLALGKGLRVHDAVAEALPFQDKTFDFALMVTTICFVDDVRKCFEEVYRILKTDGCFVLGMVDGNSSLGQTYQRIKNGSKFYSVATFYTIDDVIALLDETGFGDVKIVQTVFGDLSTIGDVQPYRDGYGVGGFVAISAMKMAPSA